MSDDYREKYLEARKQLLLEQDRFIRLEKLYVDALVECNALNAEIIRLKREAQNGRN